MTAFPPPRPRPASDASIASLASGTDLAKGWLLALIDRAPLEDAAGLPTAELAREAPVLCAAMLEAVVSDPALDRLGPGGDRAWLAARAGLLAGSTGPAGAAAAVEALRATLSAALRAALPAAAATGPLAGADLAERVAHVCAVVLSAVLEQEATEPARAGTPTPPVAVAPPRSPLVRPPLTTPGEPPEPISLHDHRGHLSDAAGAEHAAIDRQLARQHLDSRPFAVLAAEVDDLERRLALTPAAELAVVLEQAERAIAETLRPADQLIKDVPGRYWLVAPDTDGPQARDLGVRLAAGVVAATEFAGTPLDMSVGVAVCPQDGTSAEDLAERADSGVFAARAAGLPVA